MTLTHDQQNALQRLADFYLSPPPNQIALTGGAGVGKSFLLAHFIGEVCQQHHVMLLAPTHKAKGVLLDFVDENSLDVKVNTISSFLGLRPVVNAKGKRYFGIETTSPDSRLYRKEYLPQDKCVETIEKKSNSTPRLVVVDEASMVKDFEYYLLVYCAKKLNFSLLWCGDNCQLPPIQKHKPIDVSKPFSGKIAQVELREIVRYQGEVLKLCTELRNNILENKLVVPDYKHFWQPNFKSKSINYFKHNCDAQVIAWLNRTVDAYNDDIRESLYGECAEKYELLSGERVVLNSSYNNLPSGMSLYVEEVQGCDDLYAPFANEFSNSWITLRDKLNLSDALISDLRWQYFFAYARNIYTEFYFVPSSCSSTWKSFCITLRKKVSAYCNEKVKSNYLRKQAWKLYYMISESHCNFSYGYAITADKAQGSTYDTVFVDAKDILRRTNTNSIKRFYVAISRTQNELFIS